MQWSWNGQEEEMGVLHSEEKDSNFVPFTFTAQQQNFLKQHSSCFSNLSTVVIIRGSVNRKIKSEPLSEDSWVFISN